MSSGFDSGKLCYIFAEVNSGFQVALLTVGKTLSPTQPVNLQLNKSFSGT